MAMTLTTQADRQLALEQEALDAGIVAYRKRQQGMLQRGQNSDTDSGKRIAAGKLEVLADAITKFIEDAKKKPGVRAAAVKYMELLEPEVLAFLTIRSALDSVAGRYTLNGAALNVVDGVEDECRFRKFEERESRLFNTVNNNFDKSPWNYSSERRRSVIVHAANKFNIQWDKWSSSERLHLGVALLSLLIENVGLVGYQLIQEGRRKSVTYLVACPDLTEWINDFNAEHELMSPRHMPMIVPPRTWTDPYTGSYFDPRLSRRLTLVKRGSKGYLRELSFMEMPQVYQAVNTLQETPWKINNPMLTIINEIWDSGLEVKGLPSRNDRPLPAKPTDFDTNTDARNTWKKGAGDIYRSNVRDGSKRLQTAKIKFLAEKFAPEASIYFPVQLDFRGRMYSVPLFLNPQGCDLAKSLLTFAEGKPLGKTGVFWLGVHLANTFGEDKCRLQARHDWAVANSAKIEASANDPIGCRWWMDADKPFQFLAACVEWLGYLHDGGEQYVCSLPIMVDGSCNGLQHFSAMLRDEVCGAKVNLMPSDKPADIYQTVADEVFDSLRNETRPECLDTAANWLAYGINRKLCKRPVMVLPYGGTQDSVTKYILEYVITQASEKNEANPFGDKIHGAVRYLSSVVWVVMKAVVKGPRLVMDWLRATARLMTSCNQRIYWTAPDGFWVKQAYPKTKARRVKTKLGKQVVFMTVKEELKDRIDGRKQAQAISPNFVHSLDASALVTTINKSRDRGVNYLAAIHDSYGTRAADMQVLMDTLRESFVEMYESHDVLAEFSGVVSASLAVKGKQAPAIPAKGNLNLSGILKSDFFFA